MTCLDTIFLHLLVMVTYQKLLKLERKILVQQPYSSDIASLKSYEISIALYRHLYFWKPKFVLLLILFRKCFSCIFGEFLVKFSKSVTIAEYVGLVFKNFEKFELAVKEMQVIQFRSHCKVTHDK